MSDDSSMGMIARATLITGSAALIASILALIRTRVIATLQGTEGVGLLGEFVSLQGLIASVAGLGLGTGLVKYLSQYMEAREYHRISSSIYSAVVMVAFCSVTASAILVALSNWISSLIVGNSSAQLYVVIIAISVPLVALTTICNSVINGAREIKSLARISVYSSLGGLALAVPIVLLFGIVGVVIQIVAASAINFAMSFSVCRSVEIDWLADFAPSSFDKEEAKLLLHYGAVSMITGILLPLTLLITQTAVIRQEGLSENGLFTAAWALFWLYIGFATTSIAIYLFPTMSATKEHSDLSLLANNSVRFLAVSTTPIAVVIILIPSIILTVLYSSDFTDASLLLQIMVLAGAIRIISFPVSIMLVAKRHLKVYLPIEVSWYLIFAGIVVTLLPSMGIEVVGVAVLVAYFVHMILYVTFVKRVLGLFYTARNWVILVTSAGLLIMVFVLNQGSATASYAAAAILLPIWLFYATEKSERSWFVSKILRFTP